MRDGEPRCLRCNVYCRWIAIVVVRYNDRVRARASVNRQRRQRRLTVIEAAAALGVPNVYVSRWIRRGWVTAHRQSTRVVLLRRRTLAKMLEDPRIRLEIVRYLATAASGKRARRLTGKEWG